MSRQRERRLQAEEKKGRASVKPDGGAMTPEERVRFLAKPFEKGNSSQVFLESSPDAIVGVGEDGRIQIVNHAAEALFQYRREELLGRSMEILVPERFRAQHEIDRSRFSSQPYFRSMGAGRELYCRRKDGTEFPADISLNPLETSEGLLVLSIVRDISKQRRVEEERERLLSILEHTTDFVGMADIHGNALYLNKGGRKMLGVDMDEDATKHQIWEDHPAWARGVIENEGIPMAIRDGVWSGETAMLCHAGREIPVSQVIIAHKARDGSAQFFSTIARDITERKRTEEELRESEDHYRSLFENMLNGYAYCRMLFDDGQPRDFIYLAVNDAFERLTGLKEVVGKKVSEVISGIQEFDPGLFEIYGRVARTGVPEKFETYLESLKMWLAISVYCPSQDHFVALFDVITERKRTDEQLRASREVLELAIQATGIGPFEWTLNTNVLRYSPEWKALLGYGVDEIEDRYEEWEDRLHPDDKGRVLSGLHAYLENPRGNHYSEFRLRHKDGSYHWYHGGGLVLEDSQGKLDRMIGTLQDITERKKAEEALRESEEKYRMVIENVQEVVYVMKSNGDPMQGSVQLLSPYVRNVVGHEPTEFLEDPTLFFRVIHPDDVPAVVQATHNILTTRQPGIREFRVRHKETGEYRWIEDSVVPQFDDSGNMVALFGVARDVTERQRLETQLQEAQKMEAIGRLVGGLAHDFNNLLMVIKGHAALLRPKRSLGKSVTQSIKEIGKATDSAVSITHQLLAIAGRQTLKPEIIELNALIRKTLTLLHRLIGDNIRLITSLNPQPCHVQVDPGQMEQVIINLAANARDAMPNGGKLSIQTANIVADGPHARKEVASRKGRYVVLSMTDTGIGIDEEMKARIFEPFFTTKKGHGSTGLGLATVFGIVKQSKGHISVSSEKKRGTTFTIYLPRVAKRSRKVGKSERKEVVSKGKETVLLLEDSRAVRKLLRAFLERQGHLILEAAKPSAALKLARRRKSSIHLLVTDVVLPEMDGPQVAAQLAKVHPEIKVLFISGYAGHAVRGKRLLSRRGAFLQKPFSMETLARRIRKMLDS